MKTIMLAALALGMSGVAAMAQETSSTSPRAEDAMHMPDTWQGPIGDAFYTDNTWTTLRPEAEITTRWTALNDEQKAQVKADCADIAATNPAMTTDPDTTKPSTNGSVSGSSQGGLKELCAWVKNM
ncbi:MAG: hypothetical protein JNL61_18790 [Rhizobiaceae bacterium]|nr:hypothetical protein [Rhizobiaceae bacterium]